MLWCGQMNGGLPLRCGTGGGIMTGDREVLGDVDIGYRWERTHWNEGQGASVSWEGQKSRRRWVARREEPDLSDFGVDDGSW